MKSLWPAIACVIVALCAPLSAEAREPDWPETLTIATASPGGTYHVYGEGLARLLTRKLGLPVFTRESEGPAENLKLLEAGQIELAFVTLGIAQQGWNGTGDWTGGRQYRAARALFPMYDTPFQFVVPSESPIQSMADLAGKRVGIGPRGGTGGVYTPLVFRALNIGASYVTGSWTELMARLNAHSLDALVVVAGVPVPEVTELERSGNARYLTLAPSQIVAIRLALPEIAPSSIAAGTYASLRRAYRTVGVYNFAVARAGLPDSLVDAILEAVFRNPDDMMEIHPAAAESIPSNFSRNTILPFHDGAARWYNSNATTGVVRGD